MSGKIDGGGCDVLQRTKMEVMGMFDERRGQIKGEEGEGELMWLEVNSYAMITEVGNNRWRLLGFGENRGQTE